MDQDRALAMTLLRTVIPVIVLMGTVGNTLSFCVLVRRGMRSTPMYFYLTLLAVADTFVLYVSAFKVWIRAVTQFEVLHLSNVGCKLFMFILLCSFYLSAWLVVLVTLDRFLVICFPFRGYLLLRIRRARLTAAVLAVVVAVYNGHVFWTISLHQYGSALTCDADEDNFFMMHVFEYLKLISYCVVPFVIVVTLNVCILVRINRVYTNAAIRRDCGQREAAAVYRHQTPLVVLGPSSTPIADNVDHGAGGVVWPQRQQFVLSLANSTSSTTRSQSPVTVQKLRQRRLTRMLLFISFAWLALTAPFTLHSFLPGPSFSSPSSSSSTSNFSTSNLSASTTSTFSQLVKSVDANSSTVDRSMYQNDREMSQQSMVTSMPESSASVSIDASRYLLVKTICFLLVYVNHAINFYLYCLTGRRFRKELAAMANCGIMTMTCGTGNSDADAADAVIEMAAQNPRRRDVNVHNHHAGRMPLNQAHSSTSSRARSGRVVRKSEFVDERYS